MLELWPVLIYRWQVNEFCLEFLTELVSNMAKSKFTSYCNFCFPAGMPVASCIFTLITETWGEIIVIYTPIMRVLIVHVLHKIKTNKITLITWSVSGTVKLSTWPLSFHSVLSCMLGTWTLTATGPLRVKKKKVRNSDIVWFIRM